jgi:hypothetical protein
VSQPGPKDVVFTQYLRPNGRAVRVWIERGEETVRKASEVAARGYTFEIEELEDRTVSMTVEGRDGPVSIRLCPNGPRVPGTVDELINEAHERVVGAGEGAKT